MSCAAGVLAAAADIIEPHVPGRFRCRERAEATAADLHDAGLLRGGHSTSSVTLRAQAEAVLHARCDWSTAEAVAAELETADLLKGQGS